MGKKKKFKEKQNKREAKNNVMYFICPKCNTLHKRQATTNIGGYQCYLKRDFVNGVDVWEFYCPYDHTQLKYIDKSVIPVAMLLNKLEINFINYEEGIVEDTFGVLPFIAIQSDLSTNGIENLDKLKMLIQKEVKLKNWFVDTNINTYTTVTRTYDYDAKTQKDNITDTENVVNFFSIKLKEPKDGFNNKNYVKNYIDESLKRLYKALKKLVNENE